ncbi:MAG TPA: ribonuclease E activity regulator RraA [Anaerolineae bacterium]|nr:ribonuclease E activity regulator RraA [Anaerolineae bacterium]HMR66965.1 ribonuclease E activity regulator RraA [Anaerolineae bacterium]
MTFKTADLCDEHASAVEIADPIFRDFGGQKSFYGRIATLKVFEDNTLVRQALETAGEGRVLVVDGGGSTRCALVGDVLAQLAVDHGWAGLVVYGCIRDSAAIAELPLGLKALHAVPNKSQKRGEGQRDLPVRFAGIIFQPGRYLYADSDGVIVSAEPLIS